MQRCERDLTTWFKSLLLKVWVSDGNMRKEGAELRLRILEHIASNERPSFFQIARDLGIHSDDLAKELATLIDQGHLIVYEGGYYSLTDGGLEELKELRGACR